MNVHVSEEDLILIYYKEPGVAEASLRHVESCEACRYAAGALARVLDGCHEWQVPEPPPELGRSVWAAIAPSLESRRFRPRLGWFSALCAAAAVLLLVFVAGRYTQPRQPSILTGLSPKAQHRILEISLADHLGRAETMLTEIANSSETEPIDPMRAQDLVDEGRLMRQTLAGDGPSATLNMLDDLERFLLEAANSPGRAGELRERIASDSLLFKVRIIESNLRTEALHL